MITSFGTAAVAGAAATLLLGLGVPTAMDGASGHIAHHSHDSGSAWGGYDIQQGGDTVTGSWVNPKVNCNGGTNSVWAGFDGAGNDTVEQIGVDFECSSGKVQYNPWYEMYPRGSVYFDEKTEAGDSMTATVKHDGGSKYTMTLSDPTQNWTKTFHDSLSQATDGTSEVIMERLSDNVDDFGTMTFTNCTLDGKQFGDYETNKDVITSSGGSTQVTTGQLSGDKFPMTWKSAKNHRSTTGRTVRKHGHIAG